MDIYDRLRELGYDVQKFATHIRLPREYLEAVAPVCEDLLSNHADDVACIRADMRNPELYERLERKLDYNPCLSRFAMYVILGMDAEKTYISKGHGGLVYYMSMRELVIWSASYYRESGEYGIKDQLDWLTRFFTNDLVRLGRLEYEIYTFSEALTWNKHGLFVKGGDKIINIHIPEDGRLFPEMIIDSLKQAYEYFGCTGKAVFVCGSWLLWLKNREYMQPGSYILKFMDNFDILSSEEEKNHRDLWRVFGHRDSFVPSELPRDTGLRKTLAEYLETHDNVFGRGYGVLAFDGEKIYN